MQNIKLVVTDENGEIGQGEIVKGLFNQVKGRIHWKRFLDECLYKQWAEYQVDKKSESFLLNVELLPWGNTICFLKTYQVKLFPRKYYGEKIKAANKKIYITILTKTET